MKKLLLLAGFLFGSLFITKAQVLESNNFDALTIGNVGTNLTGTVAGQGGMFTENTTGGTNSNNSNYQIIEADFVRLNTLQITSSDAATGSRFLWKNGLDASWTSRTVGNDVVEMEVSFNTGPATASTNRFRPIIFGSDNNVIGGFNFDMNTKRLDGFAYGDFNGTGTNSNYLITLRSGGLILPADTWIRVGFAYNSATGRFTWKCNDVSPIIYGGLNGDPDFIVDEFDFMFLANTGNATASTVLIDEYSITAKASESLLSVKENSVNSKSFSVYPNPTNGLITITNDTDATISSVEVSDFNGRIVKTVNPTDNQINISEFSQGIYLMKIISDKGIVTKKVVKE